MKLSRVVEEMEKHGHIRDTGNCTDDLGDAAESSKDLRATPELLAWATK